MNKSAILSSLTIAAISLALACVTLQQQQQDVIKAIDDFKVFRSGSPYVAELERKPSKDFVKPTYKGTAQDSPALANDDIPRLAEKNVSFELTGGEQCQCRVEVFQIRNPSANGAKGFTMRVGQQWISGHFFSTFVIAGRAQEWTKVRQIITEHRITINKSGQADKVHLPQTNGGQGQKRLPRLERDDPIVAAMAKIGGPVNAPKSILVFNDNPGLFNVNSGDAVEGTATAVATGDHWIAKRRYSTYLYAKCSQGTEKVMARVDWGIDLDIVAAAFGVDTTGTLSLPTPTITGNPSLDELTEAGTNGKLKVNQQGAVLFDVVP